jgi:serine/threonine-protein kinase
MLVGQQIGPFSIEKELGSGAMGTVFRARYTKTGQRVAIKIMAPGLGTSATALARFEREGDILKQLKHPNIVRLYATGKYHNTPFYAMEYIQGESLDRVMARRGRISWEEVVELGKQLCSALQHAHGQGIIHRDLKPSNLMVVADGSVKLTDFGIAKDLDVTQLTSANCTVGTASYMSPEQCRGERDLTHKSDLYSMGVLFYELITGRKPFVAETPMDMFVQHVQGTFERPSRLVLDLPIWLDTLICQLLEKKPEQRPYDAAAVAAALDRIQEKVEAQLSAGVDVVRTRAADRPRDLARLNEEDKEAARTLLGKKRKKGRKKSSVPFYQRIWFKAVAFSALLVGIGFVFYLTFVKEPSIESLYNEAKDLMADRTNWAEARQGPLKKFLKYYRDRDDAQAAQMRAWADQVDVEERERLLLRWIKQGKLDTDIERTAGHAVSNEELGDLDQAWKNWERLLPNKESRDDEIHSWGLLAEKRQRDLQLVFDRDRQLTNELKEARKKLQAYKPEGLFKPRAATALHYEVFGDIWTARERWQDLKRQFGKERELRPEDSFKHLFTKDGEKRPWYLLAAWHSWKLKNDADADGTKARLTWLRDKMKQASSLAPKKPQEAKKIYHDMVALYDKNTDTDLAKLATEAQQKMDLLK